MTLTQDTVLSWPLQVISGRQFLPIFPPEDSVWRLHRSRAPQVPFQPGPHRWSTQVYYKKGNKSADVKIKSTGKNF